MSKEAMKQALEKIANALPAYIDGVAAREYLTVIHKALAEQPTQQGHSCYCPNCEALSKELAELQAQKPIAWRVKWPAIGGGYKWMMVDSPLMEKEGFVNEALYGKAQALAEQPAQQEPVVRWDSDGWGDLLVDGLPDGTLLYTSPSNQPGYQAMAMAVTRLQKRCSELEGKQPAQQEPVAWALSHSRGIEFNGKYPMQSSRDEANRMAQQHLGTVTVTPLYTSPPAQRTWVGLTDEEIEARAISFYNPEMYKRAVLWAQEKLKERNQ